ncbi:hypothetical protein Tdes44962_MAKER02653 [Teratosphaeria destructans]|uniref:Uncharacterized protein n=1 Tax=Teratosphaeria destructans TaxID=418781 RepID=A0A9W7SSC1_9PEZI|nr:hypothetical protein Tdes44962_MAKER02653 [Teratosphaeria destructans]
MNSTASVTPATLLTEDSTTRNAWIYLYLILGLCYHLRATYLSNRLLLYLLRKTQNRIFAFLEPWTMLVHFFIFRTAGDYLDHYGIVLHVSEASSIRVWPPLDPLPDCRAQANELLKNKFTGCVVDEFKAWVWLLGQPGGVREMLSPLAVGRIMCFVGVLWFWSCCGILNVRAWEHAVREGRAESFVAKTTWRRGNPWHWKDDERDERLCKLHDHGLRLPGWV